VTLVKYEPPPPDPLRPAFDLSALIKNEIGVELPPEDIVELFRRRWTTLSRLAHHIHGALGK
jgi:acyl carrier protein